MKPPFYDLISSNLTALEVGKLLRDIQKQHKLFDEEKVLLLSFNMELQNKYWWESVEDAIALLSTAPEDKLKAGIMRIQLKRKASVT